MSEHLIRNEDQLADLFGTPSEAASRKEVPFIHPVYRQWIEASPFAVLATVGPGGVDTSPRGDPAPLVRVVDEHTLLLPERRGNNRVDGLRNILANPAVALLFFIPGVNETVRVNGRAVISVAPDLLQSFAVGGALPKCVLQIRVETMFFQCARAFLRSGLWNPDQPPREVPSPGRILAALTDAKVGGAAYDRELVDRLRSSLY